MSQTLFEKLQLQDEKNLLIQGIPSSIEKQFVKLSFAKNVTPLLKSRKIDFALVFAVNQNQLTAIMQDVLPALNDSGKLWIAYPKTSSKIVSDLNRDCSWACLRSRGYEHHSEVTIDHVWTAVRFHQAGIPRRENTRVAAMAENMPEAAPVSRLGSRKSDRFEKIPGRV
jgi:hypothetical protein